MLGQPSETQIALPRGGLRNQFLSGKARAVYVPLIYTDNLNLTHKLIIFAVYALAQELYPDKFRPTLTHSFIKLLSSKSLLHTCFTQNIDTLERRAGVPAEKIIEAHGSFATQRCIDCRKPYDDEKMKEMIMSKQIPRCGRCRGLVKPDIVFFGESVGYDVHRGVPHLCHSSKATYRIP